MLRHPVEACCLAVRRHDQVLARDESSGGFRGPPVVVPGFRRVGEADPKARREPGDLALPVCQQRCRSHEQGRGGGKALGFLPAFGQRRLLLQLQQDGDHLDGLAQAHVVGQTRAEAKALQQPEPIHARRLIGPQLRLETWMLGGFGPWVARQPERLQRFRQPVSRDHVAPVRVGARGFVTGGVCQPHARDHPHGIEERDSVLACLFPGHLPVVEDVLELLRIHFDPASPKWHEATCSPNQRLPLFLGQLLAAERGLDFEIEHGIETHSSTAAVPDPDRHLGTGALAVFPPVRDAHENARCFKRRNLLQEPVRLHRRPRLGLEQASALQLFPGPGRRVGSHPHRLEQRLERGHAPGTGELLECPAEGQVHGLCRCREPVGEGSHEGEGRRFGPLVLRQVERHPPEQVHGGIDLSQPRFQPACLRRLGPAQRIEFAPHSRQQFRRHVLAAFHRGCAQRVFGQDRWIRLDRRKCRGIHPGWRMCQRGQVFVDEPAPEHQPGIPRARFAARCHRQQSGRRSIPKSRCQLPVSTGFGGHEEATLRQEVQRHAPASETTVTPCESNSPVRSFPHAHAAQGIGLAAGDPGGGVALERNHGRGSGNQRGGG